MESDSLVNRTVSPVEFVPASIVSSDGFIPIRRRAKRKRARIFESSDIGNVDNCLVNDNNGNIASSENGEAVDIVTDDVTVIVKQVIAVLQITALPVIVTILLVVKLVTAVL